MGTLGRGDKKIPKKPIANLLILSMLFEFKTSHHSQLPLTCYVTMESEQLASLPILSRRPELTHSLLKSP